MIETLTGFPDNVVAFVGKGRIAKTDYKTVIEPRIDEALKKHDKIRIYYEIGEDFDGIGPGAMWEDFLVGMGHLTRWERIALVTDVSWIENSVKLFRFLMPHDFKLFRVAEAAEARKWIAAA